MIRRIIMASMLMSASPGHAEDGSALAAESRAAARSGKVTFTATINVLSALPASAAPTCTLQLIHYTTEGETRYSEEASVVSTRAGAKATCTVTIPYRWAAADTAGTLDAGLVVAWTVAPASRSPWSRTLTNNAVSIAVPANGTTTTRTFTLDF